MCRKSIRRTVSVSYTHLDVYKRQPELLAAETAEEEIGMLADRISAFHRGGYTALGIITRTNTEAKELFDRLKERQAEVNLITPESKSFQNGEMCIRDRGRTNMKICGECCCSSTCTAFRLRQYNGKLFVLGM